MHAIVIVRKFLFQTNIASESRSSDTLKPSRSKHGMSSFKFHFDTIRPDRLNIASSFKKTNLRFTRDAKKGSKNDLRSPGSRSDIMTPPKSLNLSDSVAIEMADTSSPAIAEKTIIDEIKEETPKCWRTLYHLLELYSTMPETKTIQGRQSTRQQLPVIEEEPSEKGNISTPSGSVKTRIDLAAEEEAAIGKACCTLLLYKTLLVMVTINSSHLCK